LQPVGWFVQCKTQFLYARILFSCVGLHVCMKQCEFYPNVTTSYSSLCYRKSICRLSVCNVRAPYSGVENIGSMSCLRHPHISSVRDKRAWACC